MNTQISLIKQNAILKPGKLYYVNKKSCILFHKVKPNKIHEILATFQIKENVPILCLGIYKPRFSTIIFQACFLLKNDFIITRESTSTQIIEAFIGIKT